MKDEIKEILNDFEIRYPNKTKILLDYITNLQEENERLKEIINDNMTAYLKGLEDGKDKMKQCFESIYKSRNEKAIEYINSKHNWYGDEEEDNEDYLFELEDFEQLLNILQGSDNNE